MATAPAPIEPRERAFYYFSGHLRYAQMDAYIDANFEIGGDGRYLSRSNRSQVLVGFAFRPVKTYFSNASQFETRGISVDLVTMGATPQTSTSSSPLTFGFQAVPATGLNAVSINFAPGDSIDLGSYISGASAEDTYNLLVNYNQSREFELAYLDYESYVFFKENFSPQSLFFSRASISMPIVTNASASDYKNYRTLKFSPHPFPNPAALQPEGLEDVAYRLGVPCPPKWYDLNIASEAIATAPQPVMFSAKTTQQIGNTVNIPCGCMLNSSDIRNAMLEQGLAKDEFTKPINVWRYILIRLLIWGLILIVAGLIAWRVYLTVFGGKGAMDGN